MHIRLAGAVGRYIALLAFLLALGIPAYGNSSQSTEQSPQLSDPNNETYAMLLLADCCAHIQDIQITPTTDDCCFKITGTVGKKNQCFLSYEFEEFIGGVWVNDAVSYVFNADGTFSLTKCLGYGTHTMRLLFTDFSGHVICIKELSYTCEHNCCDRIQNLQITPSADDCCFKISGTVGEPNQCFQSYEFEEFIGGVWVNDAVSYVFNADGTFSLTKCLGYGTHTMRLLFTDFQGNVICIKELGYTCEHNCCDRIQNLHITPLADDCCFIISGTVGQPNQCFQSYEFEEFIGGVWVNDAVSYVFNADGTFSLTKCLGYGTHTMRLLFRDFQGNIICIKELSYNCENNCCDRIQNVIVTPLPNENCCFTISGTVGEPNQCFQSYEFEEFIGGVWVNDAVSYVFNADGTFSLTKCLGYGTHIMRLIFKDFQGKVICIKELSYTCEHNCCDRIQLHINPLPGHCCFEIVGTVGQPNDCFQSYEFEEFIAGVWVNDAVSYVFNANGSFSLTKCLGFGTHIMRLLFRDFHGNIICIKEINYTCQNDCCQSIQNILVTPLADACCFKISGTIGKQNNCFQSYEFEEFIGGVWVNDLVSYIFNPDGTFSLVKCLGYGTHTMRLIFRDFQGHIICIKELSYTCENNCCDRIQNVVVTPLPNENCCFTISGTVGRPNNCFQSYEFEELIGGVWVNDAVSYIFHPDGTFSLVKCLGYGTHTMRLIFRDFQGHILCIKNLTFTCENTCCDRIQNLHVVQLTQDCCFKITGTVGKPNQCFQSYDFEELIGGVWVNDAVSYVFNPDGTFSLIKCLGYGTHIMRLLFRDFGGNIICIKELTFTCQNTCCDRIQNVHITPLPRENCCFRISGTVGVPNQCFQSYEFEELIGGVWVNDAVSYIFNPDGSFALVKCLGFGTHTMRILFRDFAGNIICIKNLTYTCVNDCCERIQNLHITPLANGACCFEISGTVGEPNQCFQSYEFEELIGGVWVNDAVSYIFHPDGTFSLIKCLGYGTHTMRLLFRDFAGNIICIKDMSYTCLNDCCERIQNLHITPLPDACCFEISGTVGEPNQCFQSYEFEEFIGGVWVNDAVSYVFHPDGTFSLVKCLGNGTHTMRLLFRDFAGNIICIKELSYTCDHDCCENIQNLNVIGLPGSDCCFTITGTVGKQNQCFQSYEFEEFIGGVWVNDAVSYIFNPDGTFSLFKCLGPGTHIMRLLFRDFGGNIICIKELSYTCEHNCCDRIQNLLVTALPNENCCFQITGTVGEPNDCFQSYDFEELIGGVWVNDAVSYVFHPDGTFSLIKCLGYGTHTMRLLFRDFAGNIICIKELSFTCDHPCCDRIKNLHITPLPNCCFKITGTVGRPNKCFQSYEFEELIGGVWVNDAVSYVFNPDGSFSLMKCLGAGTHIIRLIFRDFAGNIICIKELTFTCTGKYGYMPGESEDDVRHVNGSGIIPHLYSAPNPASEQTTVYYELNENADVQIVLYNTMGEKVLVLAQGQKEAGLQEVPLSVSNLPSGLYFVRLMAGGTVVNLPITVVK